jgi:hypothetical protein
VSRQALTPTNVPASAVDISTPTLRTGDLYYNTTIGLMAYNGSVWIAVSASSNTDIDGGVFDSIAPYQGGFPEDTATQTFNGGTP